MAITNVSTYQIFQQTLGDVTKVSSELAQQQGQLSSGNKSRDFAGIANQLQQYLSLNAAISQSDQYLNDNKTAQARLDTTSSILGQLITVATDLNNLIAQRRTGVQVSGAFQLQLEEKWQIMAGQLNTSSAGRYLFSGSQVDRPAVDVANFPSLVVPGVPDDGYYIGSKQDITLRADNNILITYNVRADDPGIQKIFAGMALARQADIENSDELFEQAYQLIQQGVTGVVSTKATVDANKVALTSIDTNHETFKLYWKGLQESIGNTDIVAVSTQVAVNQGVLQAAFQAFAKINSLRLSDFLR
jgi:flagellar hook-associated protein 3 FlgL